MLRLVSFGLMAGAFVVLGHDLLANASATPTSGLTCVSDLWTWLAPHSLYLIRTALERIPLVGTGFEAVLLMPISAALAGLSFALYAVSRLLRRHAAPGDEARWGLSAKPASWGAHRSELASALLACRGAFVGVGVFTGMSNVLMLTGSFFMLEVYDRVLPSRSVPTLVALVVLATMLFSAQAVLDLIRSRLLVRVGTSLDDALSSRVYEAVARLPLKSGPLGGSGLQPLRDLDSIRTFLSGQGPTVLFDLPWIPVYLGIVCAFHPLLGIAAFVGALVLVAVALMTEFLTRAPVQAASRALVSSNAIAESSRRNAEVLTAMGLVRRMGNVWRSANENYIASQQRVSDVAGGLGAVSRVLRIMLQSAILATGAYLVILQQASGGIIIAGSILTARALAPVDQAIANWRGFLAARQGWRRLVKILADVPTERVTMPLEAPAGVIEVETLSVAPPGVQKLVVQDVSLKLTRGQALGIVGPSGSGKSSLARALVGVWPAIRGRVKLDGATLDQWSREDLGRNIGYLPQRVELFTGSIAQNISRFDPKADPANIIAAAKGADVHNLIVNLAGGYDAQVGEHGSTLSAGQQQRIALARSLYGDPFLVVLDEPNSNLDAEGEQALSLAIEGVRRRGGIVVVISHRPSAVTNVDFMLVMSEGRMQAFGRRDEILAKVLRPAPLKVVPQAGGANP